MRKGRHCCLHSPPRHLLSIPAPHQGHQQHLHFPSARAQHSWTALAAQLGQPSAQPAQGSLSPLQLGGLSITHVAAVTWSTGPTLCDVSSAELNLVLSIWHSRKKKSFCFLAIFSVKLWMKWPWGYNNYLLWLTSTVPWLNLVLLCQFPIVFLGTWIFNFAEGEIPCINDRPTGVAWKH